MYLKIQGLVLRVTPYKDADGILTLLTPTHGKLTVKARALRRRNNPLTAPCQLLAFGEFTLFEYRGMYTVNEASSIELFHSLRNDLQKLSLGTYFAQIAEVLSQEDMPNAELLTLTLNCLFALSKLNVDERLVKAVFEFRCACLAGYMPDLGGCWRCGSQTPDRFDLSEGRLECSACKNGLESGIRMPVSPGTLDAMRYIASCDSKRLFGFTAGEGTIRQFSQISESYLSTQLERGFSALDFYKSLLVNDPPNI